jgi:hypothetical protein
VQIQREIERKAEKKRQEIADLQKQLHAAESYLAALQDTLKMLPKDGDAAPVLRPESDLAKARDFIRSKGCPQHVSEILKGINKDPNKANKVSLSGSLGNYVRKGNIFTKPAPNTFGLIELDKTEEKTETDPITAMESLQKANY